MQNIVNAYNNNYNNYNNYNYNNNKQPNHHRIIRGFYVGYC